jgi:hypothetical protein
MVPGMWKGALLGLGAMGLLFACGSSDDSSSASGGGGTTTSGGTTSTGGASGSGAASGSGGSGDTGGTSGASGAGAQDGGGGVAGATSDAGDAGPLTAAECLAKQYVNNTTSFGLDYDQFHPVIGSHCEGTNHQNIQGVQKVVFLGDSVTVGTPPTNINPGAVYRAQLANKLASLFKITPPGIGWGGADPFNGVRSGAHAPTT